jgi:hypothetical protein
MSLRPRHYILLVVVIGLFVFNMIRHRRDERNLISTSTAPAPVVVTKPRIDTPAWAAFDHAAALRDDPPATYDPALKDLNTLIPLDANQNDGHIADIHGCMTWLEFYRQGAAQTHPDPKMKDRASHHIDDCVKYHQDTGA